LKRFFLDLELNRTITRQFAVEFNRNILLARYTQAPSLKIFNFWNMNVRAEYNVLEILNDFEVTEPFEYNHIKQTIIDTRVFEKWERPSVKAPVSDQHK